MTPPAGMLFLLAASLIAASGTRSVAGEGFEIVNVFQAGAKRVTPEFYAFGDRELPVTFEFKADAEAEIVLRVFQSADGLSAPLGPVVEAGKCSPDVHGTGRLEVRIPLPKVERRLRLVVQILTRKEGILLGRGGFFVLVYPQEGAVLKAALEQVRSRTGCDLAVFGAGEELRNYLKKNEVNFIEAGQGLPAELDPKMFYLGNIQSLPLKEWSPQTTGRVAVLAITHDEDLLPGFYKNTTGQVTCGKVTLPILETLESDPRSQESLVAAIDQTVATTSP